MELQQYVLINDGTIIDINNNSHLCCYIDGSDNLIAIEEYYDDADISCLGKALFSSDDKLDVIGYKQMLEDNSVGDIY